jgi:hypothetical protein
MKTSSSDPTNPIGAGGAIAIGLTKREYFAALAMNGILSNSFNDGVSQPLSSASWEQVGQFAVTMADKLTEELNKETE